MLAACCRRNCCQLGPERLGAGPEPAVSRMRLTVLGETRRPSFSNSPAIRGLAPAWVLAREAQHEFSHPTVGRRTPRSLPRLISDAQAPDASAEASAASPPVRSA